ncbi:MAG: DUF6899 family protein [Desulfobacca sp.]|uniref:DUF6899 family protein n=1 Tax=Desulfobacca sp. TaxID=2067990 RepID=UPI00404B3549
MPYIPPQPRQALDPLIDALAERIVQEAQSLEQEAAFAGLLNYTCTRLALQVVRRRYGRLRYWLIALLTGIFKNIADEFYRRLAAPYEDKQRRQHGDVTSYADLLQEMEES